MEHSGSGLSLIQVAMARYASGALLGFCPPRAITKPISQICPN